MANHKSAIKRARQNTQRRLRNKSVKSRIKSMTKDVRSSVGENTDEHTASTLKAAQSLIDKAAKKGVLHKRTAARKISRLSKFVKTLKA